MAELIEKELGKFDAPEEAEIFFSAHGVPVSYVEQVPYACLIWPPCFLDPSLDQLPSLVLRADLSAAAQMSKDVTDPGIGHQRSDR